MHSTEIESVWKKLQRNESDFSAEQLQRFMNTLYREVILKAASTDNADLVGHIMKKCGLPTSYLKGEVLAVAQFANSSKVLDMLRNQYQVDVEANPADEAIWDFPGYKLSGVGASAGEAARSSWKNSDTDAAPRYRDMSNEQYQQRYGA